MYILHASIEKKKKKKKKDNRFTKLDICWTRRSFSADDKYNTIQYQTGAEIKSDTNFTSVPAQGYTQAATGRRMRPRSPRSTTTGIYTREEYSSSWHTIVLPLSVPLFICVQKPQPEHLTATAFAHPDAQDITRRAWSSQAYEATEVWSDTSGSDWVSVPTHPYTCALPKYYTV